jgi:hypothetical protein
MSDAMEGTRFVGQFAKRAGRIEQTQAHQIRSGEDSKSLGSLRHKLYRYFLDPQYI